MEPRGKATIYADCREYSKSGYDVWAAETVGTAFTKEKTQSDEMRTHANQESDKVRSSVRVDSVAG